MCVCVCVSSDAADAAVLTDFTVYNRDRAVCVCTRVSFSVGIDVNYTNIRVARKEE